MAPLLQMPDAIIKQKKRGWLIECLCPCEPNQIYDIMDNRGKQVSSS